MIEEEVAIGRRAFPETQRLLAGGVSTRVPDFVDVSWHGSSRHPETGAFALVKVDGALTDLLGDILKVTAPGSEASVFVYVIGARDVVTDLSLTRRAFMALSGLAEMPLSCVVEVL